MKIFLRFVAFLLVPCLIAEPSSAAVWMQFAHNPVSSLPNRTLFADQALSSPALPYLKAIDRKRSASERQWEAQQQRIDRVTVYGVSWWFEPLIVLGAICFLPWFAASSFHADVKWLPYIASGVSLITFVIRHWDGVFRINVDGSLVFKKFREVGQNCRGGMKNRLQAWGWIFAAGLLFHLPFYIVFLQLSPQTSSLKAVSRLAVPFAWAIVSHAAAHLWSTGWNSAFATGAMRGRGRKIPPGLKNVKEISPNGKFAIVPGRFSTERSILISTKTKKQLDVEGSYRFYLSFSPHSDMVIGYEPNGEHNVRPVLLDLVSERGKAVIHPLMKQVPRTKFFNIRYSEGGRYIVFDTDDQALPFDAKTRKPLSLPSSRYCYFSSDDRWAVVAPREGKTDRLIEVATGHEVPLPEGTTGVGFFKDRSRVYVYRLHSWVAIYDLITRQTVATQKHLWSASIHDSPDGKTILVVLNSSKIGINDSHVVLMDSEGHIKPLGGLGDTSPVDEVEFSPQGRQVTVGLRFGKRETFPVSFGSFDLPLATWGLTRRLVSYVLNAFDRLKMVPHPLSYQPVSIPVVHKWTGATAA